jgi:hypothetical protein
MITESVRRYIRDETVDFHLVAVKDPLSSGLDGPRRLMQAVATKAGGLMPALASLNKKRQPFSVDAVENLLAAAPPKKRGTLFLTRSAPEVSCRLMFLGNLSPIGMLLTMQVPMDHFDGPRGQAHAGEVVELVTEIARVCPLLYGFAHAKGDLGLGGDPHVSDPLAAFKIYEAHWLNVYGRAMVENIGHERVLSTPAEKLEALPDGSVLLTTSPTPADFATDGSRVAQARALCHLCPDIPFEDALARLQARSAKLARAERDWDPDIVDLLELTLDTVAFSERQTETAKLNAYRPPEVTEWRPAAEGFPPDVDDVEAVIERYEGLYAERFVALLAKEVPGVMKATPESLPEVDFHVWSRDFPGTFQRADLDHDMVPSFGAYLGLVLRRNLRGRWVPRRDLNESQVIVGDRAYLPFQRAWRALRSKQSVLDYSMTKLFRDAERHRPGKSNR